MSCPRAPLAGCDGRLRGQPGAHGAQGPAFSLFFQGNNTRRTLRATPGCWNFNSLLMLLGALGSIGILNATAVTLLACILYLLSFFPGLKGADAADFKLVVLLVIVNTFDIITTLVATSFSPDRLRGIEVDSTIIGFFQDWDSFLEYS